MILIPDHPGILDLAGLPCRSWRSTGIYEEEISDKFEPEVSDEVSSLFAT